jgi:small subunit ribosomal protein S20
MANTTSAKRAARSSKRKAAVNKSRSSQLKTSIRAVEEAIKAGNSEAAGKALKAAEPYLMRAAQKGIVHKRSASRKVSRLTIRVKGMSKTGT